MYYRIAIQVDPLPTWKWESTALSSLNILLHWLQFYRAIPHDRLRSFSSSSQGDLNEQLVQEYQGLGSTSVPATQFLRERMIRPPEAAHSTSKPEGGAYQQMASIAVATQLSFSESDSGLHTLEGKDLSFLERRRLELEVGTSGDHDLPSRFALPISMLPARARAILPGDGQEGSTSHEP